MKRFEKSKQNLSSFEQRSRWSSEGSRSSPQILARPGVGKRRRGLKQRPGEGNESNDRSCSLLVILFCYFMMFYVYLCDFYIILLYFMFFYVIFRASLRKKPFFLKRFFRIPTAGESKNHINLFQVCWRFVALSSCSLIKINIT